MNPDSSDDDDIPGIDFRFFEIAQELGSLKDYFRTTEQQLPVLAEHAQEQLFEELGADEDSYRDVSWFAHRFAEDVLPRFFRSPILVALWAIYESGTNEIADYLQKQGGHALGLRDIKGKSEFDRINKYFQRVLGLTLITDTSAREHIELLLLLRNAIAHGNGREGPVKPVYWNKIKSWERRVEGLSTDYGYVTFSGAFVAEMLTIVGNSLDDLIERAKTVRSIPSST